MVRPGAVRDGLRLAGGTLTVVPVPPPRIVDRSAAGVAMAIAPLAAAPVGLVAGAVAAGALAAHVPLLVVAALGVAAAGLATRGLHLDGLADTADGLAASRDRATALEVMRRGDVGPAGAATLAVVLIVQIAAAATILSRPWGPLVFGTLLAAGRCALTVACARGIPSARPDGLGAVVAGSVPRSVAGVVSVVVAGVCAAVLALSGRPWWLGVVALVVSLVAGAVVVIRSRRRLGGITGDVLGAAVEIAVAALLIASAAG